MVSDPFAWLGAHPGPEGGVVVRVLWPGPCIPKQVEVIGVDALGGSRPGCVLAVLGLRLAEGLFEGFIADHDWPLNYRLRVTDAAGEQQIVDDPYQFDSMLEHSPPTAPHADDLQRFAAGEHGSAYEFMGAHPVRQQKVAGVRFVVWAPNAGRVSVVGDFNAWNELHHPMRKHPEFGLWELFVPQIGAGALYKFAVDGVHKADPYARASERPPRTASVVAAPRSFPRDVRRTLQDRAARNDRMAPISVYEVHIGSWRRGDDNQYLGWRELAETLVPYARSLNFTHLQLMPIAEYPFSGSWGYQPVSLFAPSSRFGDIEEFARFVEAAHQADLGVLLDWVPAHFPNDEHGLANFDGTSLYEHADPARGVHPDWGTLTYNYARNEVRSFLLSAAQFWLDHYGVDGLRVDAVASMLYLDYSRRDGEWQPNEFGGREDLAAVDFLKSLNTQAYHGRPGAMMVAEESTAWDGVTRPVEHGGLGFGFKWNMGWMNDTLEYMQQDPVHRSHHHNQLTFSMVYAFDENFVLPLSHDEVVHGKRSLLERMPGDRWQQFANLRLLYGYMWAHPGKKLLFMGGEFAQAREWDHNHSLDWHLLAGHDHLGVQRLVADLNALYRGEPALYEADCVPGHFEWLDADRAEDSVIAFTRTGCSPTSALERVVVVCNFTPVVRHEYLIGVPQTGRYVELLNTDAERYGGSNVGNQGGIVSENTACNGLPQSIRLTLPPLATLVFKVES